MIKGSAQSGQAFFIELSVDNMAIAMISNLISGRGGFGFKIGWDPSFAKMSPGILNEIEFVKNAPELFSNLEYIDSGADEGSYIEELWADRCVLVSGIYITNALARPVLLIKNLVHRIKHYLKKSRKNKRIKARNKHGVALLNV